MSTPGPYDPTLLDVGANEPTRLLPPAPRRTLPPWFVTALWVLIILGIAAIRLHSEIQAGIFIAAPSPRTHLLDVRPGDSIRSVRALCGPPDREQETETFGSHEVYLYYAYQGAEYQLVFNFGVLMSKNRY